MRLLLIEDYEPIRKSVATGLREAGFAVDVSADGQEGLWYALNNSYDVVVLDVMLPSIDGFTLLSRIRERGNDARVLILSAKDTLDDRIAGLNLGADDYLIKPFAFDELLARVQALVRRKYDESNPVMRISDLEIDTTRKTVKRGGQLIDFTPREYSLLVFLMLRAGEVVSRTEIWENLYEFHSDAQSNVVDVYIGHLRRKLEGAESPRLIHTRRGHGYVLGETG